MKHLIFTAFAFAPWIAFGEQEIPLIKQNTPYTLEGSVYTFLNHSTTEYDGENRSLQGVKDLLAISKKLSIPVIATKHDDAFINEFQNEEQYYVKTSAPYRDKATGELKVKSDDIQYLVHSNGGQHKLQMPNAKLVIMGGGNLRACLCETLRDVVAGFGHITDDKKIVMVREATYDYDVFNENMPETEAQYVSFVDKMLLPNFDCPYQSTDGSIPAQNVSNVQLNFYADGKLLKSVERENPTGSVSVHLAPQSQLPNHLKPVTQ